MNNILSEKEYQRYIIDQLVKPECGYVEAPAAEFDRLFAMNRKALFDFLEATQPEKMEALRKIYKGTMEDTLVAFINQQETRGSGSRFDVLKHGVELANIHLDLMYTKPATTFNQELTALYHKNIFTVSEEVWASDSERVDLVIFLNGLAIITLELKCNAAGQSYQDAIYQYRMERSPKDRLFLWKAGALVNFAMDLEQVYMCTRLSGSSTFFLPFNMGCGEGIQVGAGNPILKDNYSVHYMWDDILQKDSLLEILGKFMFIEVSEKEDASGKAKKNETVIFPRYHQLDVVRKLLADVEEHGSSLNYLLQHSAGSGKTNEIAWLAHRLASLHNADNKIIFDHIIICTDRVVVDRQLQQAVLGIEHKEGLIRVMDDQCNSQDLAHALSGNTKIIATTIQKFPYIVDSVKDLKSKHFAVIIDEAHSSTAGKNMAAITKSLGSCEVDANADTEDMIAHEISCHGKQPNVSIFAFTATPKPTTLQLFGRVNAKGQYEAFHMYSMKQAIEEGFILDVLQNYITYETFYRLNKEIKDDPEMKTNEAKRQIARFVQLHETNISQRIEVIIEHFRQNVMQELNGQAKAMVITESRAGAVKYRQAFEDYIKRKGYTGLKALKDRQVLLLFDSWYAKSPLIERVLQYPHLAIICNVRSDSAMYELPPLPSGKPGRPKKRGKRIHMDDFNLSWDMDGMKVGHRVVLTHICGNRRIHAYVSCTASGSRRLFFSTLDPSALHMSCAWQERKILRDAPAEGMDFYPLKLYKLRWAIETNYYEQKTFWSLNAYRIRHQNGIEHMVNLVNLVHSSLKMLPYLDEHFAKYQNASPQELRSHISWQIQREIFFGTLVAKAQTAKNPTDLVQALCKLASSTSEVA